jgi:hypothetical protein
VAGGGDGEHLVAVVRELCDELGSAPGEDATDEERKLASSSELWKRLGGGEDGLAPRLRSELGRLAAIAIAIGDGEGSRAVRASLDGAELVIRGEIAARRLETLESHLPGITFTIALPALGRERALALSQRAAELLDLG